MMFSRATYDGPTRLDAPWLCIEEHWAGESALGIPIGISLALFTTHDENRSVAFWRHVSSKWHTGTRALSE